MKSVYIEDGVVKVWEAPQPTYFTYNKTPTGYNGRKPCDCKYWCGSSQCYNALNLP